MQNDMQGYKKHELTHTRKMIRHKRLSVIQINSGQHLQYYAPG